MNYQNSYYPYHQNVQVLKGFFAKPLTLICGIVAGLSAILGTVKFNSGSGSTNISVSAGAGSSLSILLCIALILLYVKSRSNDPMPFGGMVTLIKVYAVIGIVAASIAVLALTGFTVSIGLFVQNAFRYFIPFLIIIAPIILVTLLHSVALLMWSGSIKKGATTVYLSDRGSVLLGVTSILLAVMSIATTVAMAVFINSYGQEISELLRSLADEYPSFHYNNAFEGNAVIQSMFVSAATVITIINSVLSAVFYGLFAALAISYHMYIKKYTMGINLGAVQTNEPAAEQNNISVPPVAPVTSEMPTDSNQPPIQQPVNFQPQSVDFGSMNTDSDDKPKTTQFENPYMQAVADDTSDMPKEITCPNCHTKCNPTMKFCGNCGAKLK